jgi:hypothetical protein
MSIINIDLPSLLNSPPEKGDKLDSDLCKRFFLARSYLEFI